MKYKVQATWKLGKFGERVRFWKTRLARFWKSWQKKVDKWWCSSILTLEKSPKPAVASEVIPPHPSAKYKFKIPELFFTRNMNMKYLLKNLTKHDIFNKLYLVSALLCNILSDIFLPFDLFTCIGVILDLPTEFLLLRQLEYFLTEL